MKKFMIASAIAMMCLSANAFAEDELLKKPELRLMVALAIVVAAITSVRV